MMISSRYFRLRGGGSVCFAQLVKVYGDYGQHDAAARYSPGPIIEVISRKVTRLRCHPGLSAPAHTKRSLRAGSL
jgi:hypothetical protein